MSNADGLVLAAHLHDHFLLALVVWRSELGLEKPLLFSNPKKPSGSQTQKKKKKKKKKKIRIVGYVL
nr:hypothetical protein CFP56_29757 [Quercus suber]